jgi:hypothetical protein
MRSGNLDPHKLAEFLENACRIDAATGRAISRRSGCAITGIVPVHLYGQIADMDAIVALTKRFNLQVVEDACQAHGAAYFSRQANCWKQAGSMGDAAAFSFYPSKNLVGCRADFEGFFFPLSPWERVRVRGFSSPVGTLTPALSLWEREKAQPFSSITFTMIEY